MNKDEFYNAEDKDIQNLTKELAIANLLKFYELNKDHIDKPLQKAFYEVIFTHILKLVSSMQIENNSAENIEQLKEKVKKLVR